jgi:hypothetical protein
MMIANQIATTLDSPLPKGESVGRLRRPFLLKDAEAKLRLLRIVRCAAGEGSLRESECVERPLTRSLRWRSGFDLSPPGRGEKGPRQSEFITV